MKRLVMLIATLGLMLLAGCNLLMEEDFNAYLDERNELIKKEKDLLEEADAAFVKMMEDPNAKEQLEKSLEKYDALVKKAESVNFDKLKDLKKSHDHFVKSFQANAEGMKLGVTAFEKQDTALDQESQTKFKEAENQSKKSETELDKFAEDNDFTLEETEIK